MRRSRLLPAVLLVLCLASVGCAPYQYSQFRGSVTRGDQKASPATHELGGQFGRGLDDVPEALQGFSLAGAGGSVVFVYDKATVTSNGGRLSDAAITAVYYAEASAWRDDPWADFLRKGAAGRDASAGIQRLRGSCDVQKWKSNVDFRIRLKMRGAGPDPVRVAGVITTFDRWEFRPTEWVAWGGYFLGLWGPAQAEPRREK